MGKKLVPEHIDAKKILRELDKKEPINVDISELYRIVSDTEEKLNLNEDIFNLFPNISLAIEIMTSSIVSANTMIDSDYSLTLKTKILPNEVVNSIMSSIKEHVDTHYKFKDKLYTITEESIFTKGAYIELILPPDILVDIHKKLTRMERKLSAGVEDALSYFDNKVSSKLIDFRKANKISTDSEKELKALGLNPGLLDITENYALLNSEKVIEDFVNYKDKSLNRLSEGLEDFKIIDQMLTIDEYIELENEYSKAFVKKLNPSNVIPIADIDDPSKHYGYFLILNSNGKPINIDDEKSYEDKLKEMFSITTESSTKTPGSNIISEAKRNISSKTKNTPALSGAVNIINRLLREKIDNAIKHSVFKDMVKFDLELKDDILMAIYEKMKRGDKVKIVFVPKRYIQYTAVDYRSNGTGKSVMEDLSVLASLKAMLFLTRLSGMIKSHITITEVDIELDEDDPNYEFTLKKIINQIKRSRQMQLPIGMLKLDSMVDWLHNVGFKFNPKHPGLADIKVEINEKRYDPPSDDNGLEELLDKYMILRLGLTPEIIDNSYSPDFATTIVANNLLLNRRVLKRQNQLSPHLTNNIVKYVENDPILYNKILSILESNLPEIKKKLKKTITNTELSKKILRLNKKSLVNWLFHTVLKNLDCRLPKPEFKDEDIQGDMFEEYVSRLDKLLDNFLNTDLFTDDLIGELGEKIENQKAVIKTILLYKWLSENRPIPELNDMLSLDEDGKPVLKLSDEYKNLVEVLKENILDLLKEMNKFRKKTDEKIEKLDEESDEYTDEEDNGEESNIEEPIGENENNEEGNNEEEGDETGGSEEGESEEDESEEGENPEDDLTKGLF